MGYPFPDMKMIREVMKLRKRKLSFRLIAEQLGKDVKTIYTWHQYGTGERPFKKPGKPAGRGKQASG